MRVTDSMIADLARSSVANARDRALVAQRVASSGLRVEKPSDDPVAAAVGRRKASEQARIESMIATANSGKEGLDVVDGALAHVDDLLARAAELAVQAANATTSASDRVQLAGEVSSLRDAILAEANTRVDGRYVMGGLRQDAPPFDASGTFVGDRTTPTVEVAPGLSVATAVSAGDVFAPVSGLDIPAALARLTTALTSNDVAGIRAGIDDIGLATQQVTEFRGGVGVGQNTFAMALTLGGQMKDRVAAARSSAIEADTYDALSALTSAQTALQQAVAIAARLPLPGLAQKT